MIGLGLRLEQRSRAQGFSPRALFGSGVQGAWYDPSDLRSMFQDAAGTIPAAVDAPVGRMEDKSGNGNHVLQPIAEARPMLRQGGNGALYIETDGVGQRLWAAFPMPARFERVSAIRKISDAWPHRIYSGGTAHAGELVVDIGVIALASGGGYTVVPLAPGTEAVVTERFDGAASRIAVDNGPYTVAPAGDWLSGGISIGGGASGTGEWAKARIYGIVMRDMGEALTDGEIAALRSWMAAKQRRVI
jgi:hypothetical protein